MKFSYVLTPINKVTGRIFYMVDNIIIFSNPCIHDMLFLFKVFGSCQDFEKVFRGALLNDAQL